MDICDDKLDNSICLGDSLFNDDDATEEVVLKEAFAGEFDVAYAVETAAPMCS